LAGLQQVRDMLAQMTPPSLTPEEVKKVRGMMAECGEKPQERPPAEAPASAIVGKI